MTQAEWMPPTNKPPPWLTSLLAGAGFMGGILALVAIVHYAVSDKKAEATPEPIIMSTAGAPAAVAAPPPPTPVERIMTAKTWPGAFKYASAAMSDKFGEDSPGAALFALWSIDHLAWSDVAVANDETSYALTMKDPDEARGKRFCVPGTIIEIHTEKTDTGKVYSGLMSSDSGNTYRFLAVRSSGTLVAQSEARFCGVVTGKFDYPNSAGGTGHAAALVGMFDLPENRKAK